jgi:hypothetical protein
MHKPPTFGSTWTFYVSSPHFTRPSHDAVAVYFDDVPLGTSNMYRRWVFRSDAKEPMECVQHWLRLSKPSLPPRLTLSRLGLRPWSQRQYDDNSVEAPDVNSATNSWDIIASSKGQEPLFPLEAIAQYILSTATRDLQSITRYLDIQVGLIRVQCHTRNYTG